MNEHEKENEQLELIQFYKIILSDTHTLRKGFLYCQGWKHLKNYCIDCDHLTKTN